MDDSELMAQVRARVGTVLKGKWTIDRVLGVGGMATVYAATHRNQKRVAVKMLHPALSVHPEVRARFLREGYAANTIGHRGAVAVDDDDVTDDGLAFLVMELLEGETLEARRERRGGKLEAPEVLSLAAQLLDVLAVAHDQGVVHRDLKPDNLFLTHDGVLKVLDFGIARLRDGSAGGHGGTQAGVLLGTPAFMAPEQARGRWEMVDGQTDIWAVGATMYQLLSGRLVREAETVNEEIALAITRPAGSLALVAPELPREVVEVVDGALAYEKTGRWADARAMQAAVRRAHHALLAAPPPPAPGRAAAPAPAAGPLSPDPDATRFAGAQTVAATLPARGRPWSTIAVAGGLVVAAALGFAATRGGPAVPTATASSEPRAAAAPDARSSAAPSELPPPASAAPPTAQVEPAAPAPEPTATAGAGAPSASTAAPSPRPSVAPTRPTPKAPSKPAPSAGDPWSRRY